MLSQALHCPGCPSVSHEPWDSSNRNEYSPVAKCPTRVTVPTSPKTATRNTKPQVKAHKANLTLHRPAAVPSTLGHHLTCGNTTVPKHAKNESTATTTQLALSQPSPYGGRSLWDTAATAPVRKAAGQTGKATP